MKSYFCLCFCFFLYVSMQQRAFHQSLPRYYFNDLNCKYPKYPTILLQSVLLHFIYRAEFSVVQQYELCDREKVDVLDLNIRQDPDCPSNARTPWVATPTRPLLLHQVPLLAFINEVRALENGCYRPTVMQN